MNNPTQLNVNNVRLSYVHISKPYAAVPGQDEKYCVTILLPKTEATQINAINAAIEAAKQQGLTDKWKGVMPPIVPTPIHDGDGVRQDGTAFGPECKGCLVFTASSKNPIEVVDARMQKIFSPTEIYSGIYANVNINFFPYEFAGKKGIGCGLGPIQKLRDGEIEYEDAKAAANVFTAVTPQSTGGINPLTGQPL